MFPLSLDEPAPQGEFRYVRLHRPHTRLPPVKGVRASFWASVVGTTLSLKPKAGTRIAITARWTLCMAKCSAAAKSACKSQADHYEFVCLDIIPLSLALL